MGIDWLTFFYPDVNNTECFSVLGTTDQIIDDDDEKLGYIRWNELLRFFGDYIDSDESTLSDKSFIIEYMKTTNQPFTEMVETRRLPVKLK
jgi:hypothetical protein